MSDPRKMALDAFSDFGRAVGSATSPAEHRALWAAWSAAQAGTPDTDRRDDVVAGVPVQWVDRKGGTPADPLLVFLHGGGFSSGSPSSHLPMIAHMAETTRSRVVGVDYRLFPEHAFPAGIEDAVAVYRGLLSQGFDPRRMALVGDSAGGGLVVASLILARTLGAPMPAAAVCIGPWVDLAVTGASMLANADSDPVVKGEQMRPGALRYLGDVSPYHPLASPIYADLSGLPPLLIQVGSGEALLDDSRRLAGRARQCGVAAQLTEWPEMVHGWHQFAAFLPEARQALDEIRVFLESRPGWRAPG